MAELSRRDLLKCFAAGGAVIAGELWWPGKRTIFLPRNLGYATGRIIQVHAAGLAFNILGQSFVWSANPARILGAYLDEELDQPVDWFSIEVMAKVCDQEASVDG